MILFKNFLFVHIRKNAGTSITRALIDSGPCFTIAKIIAPGIDLREKPNTYFPHLPINELVDFIKGTDVEPFGVVRNPWDRFVSMAAAVHGDKFSPESFKHYLKRVVSNSLLTQSSYFEHTLLFAYVGKYERLAETWENICHKLQINTPLQVLNQSKHQHYSKYYDQECIDWVAKAEEKVIEKFNYNFSQEH